MQASFQRKLRKLIYGSSLIILLILLYAVGRPAHVVVQTDGEMRLTSGGFLAEYRTERGLTEAQMGELDPASSAVKLATFGMRGVAIAMLWHQANESEKRFQWNDVVATGYQIIFLEPHFVSIWDFLGWKLAYNASASFDDYRERYRWVIRGIDFLLTGLEKNRRSPQLHKRVGWTVSQKIGIADEVEQYRRLLRDDEEFGERHNCPLPSDRDNWLLGRRWYHLGEALVLSGISLGNESDPVYFANSRLNLFNYAKWKRRDGIFGEEAIAAWDWALDEWIAFGKLKMNTAIPVDRTKFRVTPGEAVHTVILETTEIVREEEKELLAELNSIAPDLKQDLAIEIWHQLGNAAGQQGSLLPFLEEVEGLNAQFYPVEELQLVRQWLEKNEPNWRERLAAEQEALIPEDQKELRTIPPLFLNEEDRDMLSKTDGEISEIRHRASNMLRLNPTRLSQEIQELEEVDLEQRRRARAIVARLDEHPELTRMSNLFRGIVGYDSRFREVAVETTSQADDAHRLRFEARRAYYAEGGGGLNDALEGWLNAMRKWDELLDLEEFQDRAADMDFLRDRIDLAERILILLDETNNIFSTVADDPVPFHRLMWQRVFHNDNAVAAATAALEYAKEEYEKALAEPDAVKRREGLETAEGYFLTVAEHFLNINFREKFMEYAPFFDLRDRILETVAYYIRSLESQGKPLPEPLILRSYVELMLIHDPAIAAANEMLSNARLLLAEEKYEEARSELDQAVAVWQAVLEKYPIIAHDPTNPAYAHIETLAMEYVRMLQAQDEPLPGDFPLRAFLR